MGPPGDSHQSHFVQVLSSGGTNAEDMTVRVFSNVDETRVVNLTLTALVLYAEVKRGNSPVLEADVVAVINGKWSVSLLDSGNGGEDMRERRGGQSFLSILEIFVLAVCAHFPCKRGV